MQEAVEALAALLVAWGEPAAWAAVAWEVAAVEVAVVAAANGNRSHNEHRPVI